MTYRIQIFKGGQWSHYGLPFDAFGCCCRKAREIKLSLAKDGYNNALRIVRVYNVRGEYGVLEVI